MVDFISQAQQEYNEYIQKYQQKLKEAKTL